MITQLKVRTEYSFRTAYGPIEQVVDHLQQMGCMIAAITDRSSTFGHSAWNKHCKLKSIKPIFGVELAFTPDITVRVRRQELYWLSLLARDNDGLREIYAAVEEATSNFYHVPRLPISKLDSFSSDILILSGNSGLGPRYPLPKRTIIEGHRATCPSLLGRGIVIPVSDNYMIVPENREVYEILIGRNAFNRPSPMHIMNMWEMSNECSYLRTHHFDLANQLGAQCNATLEPATNIKSSETRSLFEICLEGAKNRNLEMTDIYLSRMNYELALIYEKKYNDYFLVIADMVQYAKQHMLVGPARGSSCGSLVCYLLGITDVDPLQHELIFERFIDVTRHDLPDVDIDFPDDKREMVFDYLTDKYGYEHVAKLGTVSRYKAKSAIGETARAIKIPMFEAEQIVNSIIKRNDGDERVNQCIADSLNDTEIGQEFLKRYPNIIVASKLEAHARHSGTHAAGIVITNEPINHFVARDIRNNTIHLDKYDADYLNIMKVDVLGLRTLTVIADCLEQIGWSKARLLAHSLSDDNAFKILRLKNYCGVFQFEGPTLQGLARTVQIDRFTDISALTALARPGPLISGAAHEWCARREDRKATELLHPMMENITADTYGLIIFQEQMLRIIREIGGLSWEDTTALRKGMSKSLGLEYFERYWERFKEGAKEHGVDELVARQIWETVNSAGGYAFNKSHSVAYALVSYWCMVLKSAYPLQFALATLKHTADPMSIKQYLRELDRTGYKFKTYDVKRSEYGWTVKDEELIGGLTNVVGIGSKTANSILERRKQNVSLTPNQEKLLENGKTPFDDVFYFRNKFADLIANPAKYSIVSKLWQLADINEDVDANYVFLARVISWKVRSLNETQFLIKRNNIRVPNDRWLTLTLEDDSGIMPATISRQNFARWGLPITKAKADDCYLFRGFVRQGNRRIYVEKYRKL